MRLPATNGDIGWTLAAAILSGGMLGVLVTLLRKGQ